MGRVITNATTLQIAAESSLGTKPTTGWKVIEPNSIGKFGPSLKKIAREPISKNRQMRKGALVDLDSSVEFECDITYDHVKMFAEGLFFAAQQGVIASFAPTAVTATGFTVASGGAIPDGTLFRVLGSKFANNNGLHVAAGTSTGTEIKCTGLTAEASPGPLLLEICGIQGTAGDLDVNASGNITSTTINWTTGYPGDLEVGQFIWIGGDADTVALNFTDPANRGLARIVSKAAGVLTVDCKSSTFVAEANTTSTVQIFFGAFYRNVAVDVADYLERTFHLELGYENLQVPGPGDEYEYAKGNFVNEIAFDLPLTTKGTMKVSFIGLDCDPPTVTRATGANAPTLPIATSPVNTSSDFIRIRATEYDETGITTDFKSLSLMIRNNVSPEKVLGTLGGKYMNAGLFAVEATADVLFTDSSILEAMRANRTLSMQVGWRNEDHAVVMDIPSMTIEGGDKSFPVNQTVSINMKSMAFQDARFGTSASMSTFPYLPSE